MPSQNKTFSASGFFISLIKSKFFLAFAVTLLSWQTFLIEGIKLPLTNSLLLFIFCASLFSYNARQIQIFSSENKRNWNVKLENVSSLKTISAMAAGFLATILFFQLNRSVQLMSLLMAICTLSYMMPVAYNNTIVKGIRNIFIIKNVWLALVWAGVTVLLPLLYFNASVFSQPNMLLFFSRFLFVYSLTIPFDIRDVKTDAENNIKTLPVKFGIASAKIIALVSLLLFCVLLFFRVQLQPELRNIAPAFYISAFCSGIVVLISQPGNKLFFYDVLVEGMSVLQAILVFTFSYLK